MAELIPIPKLPRWEKGDLITAVDLNKLSTNIERSFRQFQSALDSHRRMYLSLMELQQDLDENDTDGEALKLSVDDEHDAFPWADHEMRPILDYTGGRYFEDEYVGARFHPPSGFYMIPPGLRMHLAVLKEDLEHESSAAATLYEQLPSDGSIVQSDMSDITVWAWGLGEDSVLPSGSEIFAFQHPKSRFFIALQVPIGRKFIRFALAEALTTSMSSADADIEVQYGPGSEGPDTTSPELAASPQITVLNLLRQDGTYEFFGDYGDHGIAHWHTANIYVIHILECP